VRKCFGRGGATLGGDRRSLGTRGTGGDALDPLGECLGPKGDLERALRGDRGLGQFVSIGGGAPRLSPECLREEPW